MITTEALKELEEQLISLFSQANISFLLGAGCSLCAGLPDMAGLTESVSNNLLGPDSSISSAGKKLLETIKKTYGAATKETPTIEDYLSELIDLDAICDRRDDFGIGGKENEFMGVRYSHEDVHELMRAIKQSICDELSKPVAGIIHHQGFVAGLHRRLRAGAEANKRPINYFVLNYDTLFEDALALEEIRFVDGFRGSSTAWWDLSKVLEESNQLRNIEARVIKLHGSIDWRHSSTSDAPMRIRETVRNLCLEKDAEPIVIYPASAKYREVERDPFAQLMRYFRSTLSITEDHVLGIMGYGFSDNHINTEIKHALETSNGRLSLIVFCGEKSPPEPLADLLNGAYADHLQVFCQNEIYKGSPKPESTEHAIDWYKFEVLSRILGGTK